MVSQSQALQSLWRGLCTISVRHEKQNPINKRTEFTETALYSAIPCRLSFKAITGTSEKDNAAVVSQITKLFLAPDIKVPPGSKITVTQNGKTIDYEQSGQPGFYSGHQEIILQLFAGWV